MKNAISKLADDRLLKMSKKEIVSEAESFVKGLIFDANQDPLEMYMSARIYQTVYEAFTKSPELKEIVMLKLDQNNGEAQAFQATLKIKNGYDKLNYKEDPVWKEYQDKIEHFKMLQKIREDLLKRAHKKGQDISDQDGEMIKRVPVASSVANTFEVKF